MNIKQEIENCCKNCGSINKPECRVTCGDIQSILRSLKDD